MKKPILIPIFVLLLAASWLIWATSPPYIKRGGPLLVVGLLCLFLVITFTFERMLVLWRAGGRGNGPAFVHKLRESLRAGHVDEAVANCKHQGGCMANVIGAGLTRYHVFKGAGKDKDAVISETRRALREATALESPLLERNLTVLSTLASIATLVGLLGTSIGMIRAFQAMSHAGAPDATQLALGISEALVNTALGLVTAILGTVLYNYFTARVDSFNIQTEETAYEVLQLLENEEP
jgi:biopolymer transport protein ExbB